MFQAYDVNLHVVYRNPKAIIEYDYVLDLQTIEQHDEDVRKETAREILKPLYNVIMEHPDCCVNLSEDIKFLMEKYGIDLENKE